MTELNQAHRERLMGDLKVVIADAEELLRLSADQVGDSAIKLRDRVQLRLNQAKTDLLNLQESAIAGVKAAGHATDEFVHENPWKSIGIAAGVGLVVGLLIGRR